MWPQQEIRKTEGRSEGSENNLHICELTHACLKIKYILNNFTSVTFLKLFLFYLIIILLWNARSSAHFNLFQPFWQAYRNKTTVPLMICICIYSTVESKCYNAYIFGYIHSRLTYIAKKTITDKKYESTFKHYSAILFKSAGVLNGWLDWPASQGLALH